MALLSPIIRFKRLSMSLIMIMGLLVGLGSSAFLVKTMIKRDQLQHAHLIARYLNSELTSSTFRRPKNDADTFHRVYKHLRNFMEVQHLMLLSPNGDTLWSDNKKQANNESFSNKIFQAALKGKIQTEYMRGEPSTKGSDTQNIQGFVSWFSPWVPRLYIPVHGNTGSIIGIARVDRYPAFTIHTLVLVLALLWSLLVLIGIVYFLLTYRLFVHASNDLVSCEVDLEKSRRLAEVGECVSMIVHDTRNLMASIRFVFERLHSGQLSIEEQERMIDRAKRPLEMSFAMMEDLLGFVSGKHTALQCFKHNLHALIEDGKDMLLAMLEASGHKLVVNVPKDLIIYWDAQKLLHILVNLARNSSESMTTPGTVSIDAIRVEGGVQVYVRDTGEGIAEEILPKLFEPFVSETGKNRPGLGLAIIRDLVRRHGGNVVARNQPQGGAEFELYFPDCPDYPEALAQQVVNEKMPSIVS